MKYMGSKNRIKKDLSKIINEIIENENIKNYVEPFVGGANLIDSIICENKKGYDINEYLISMFNALKNGYIPPRNITKEFYKQVKENKDNFSKELVSIVGFCASYNAKWFGGYAPITLTKTGVVRDYYDESIRNLMKQKENLKDVTFIHSNYENIKFNEKTLIYCDPPYAGTTEYNVSKNFDHDNFWRWVREQSENHIVIVSEYNAPDDFECIYEKKLTNTLDKNSRSKATEKMFILKV